MLNFALMRSAFCRGVPPTLACSRRSDSGERCEVKGARKNKSEGGGEVREGTPVRFVLNRLIRPLRPHQL